MQKSTLNVFFLNNNAINGAGVDAQNVSDDAKMGVHKAVSDTKIAIHKAVFVSSC
jgi:hypothetical protein